LGDLRHRPIHAVAVVFTDEIGELCREIVNRNGSTLETIELKGTTLTIFADIHFPC
jgi:hypothetical protein